jgi:hypothetical protein
LNESREQQASTDDAGGDVRELRPENIRTVRIGHGANCSSVGSVIDTLFLASAVGGAIFAAVCAALRDEPARIAGAQPGEDAQPEREESGESAA